MFYIEDYYMKNIENKSKYVSLAPRGEKKEEYEEYYNALDFAMKDKSIRNIAITGSYGAGKSSVIDSYFNNHKEIKCIRISLAYFSFARLQNKYNNENNKKNIKISEESSATPTVNVGEDNIQSNMVLDNNPNENNIEVEVLKNLFYSIDGKKLKNNRYLTVKAKRDIKEYFCQGLFVFSIITMIVLLKIVFVVLNNILSNINNMKYALEIMPRIPKLYAIVCLLFCLSILIVCVGSVVTNYDKLLPYIKSIVFKNARIDTANMSIINHYLHEIMNYMVDAEESVFIFEDLDRYENYAIFEKLRNLCILINNNEIIKKKFEYNYNVKGIKFIYAVKDDFVFANNGIVLKNDDGLLEERTKFFDFVIPIIPKITQSNIRDAITDNIKRLNVKDIEDSYIFIISNYLTSLRMVNNIFNEFQIYKNTLCNGKDFDDKQLLTMIAFKNLYPKEFVEYQQSGVLEKMIIDIDSKKYSLLKHSKKTERTYEPEIKRRGINALSSQDQAIYRKAKKYIDLLENKKIEIYDDDIVKSVFSECGNNEFIMMATRNGFINNKVNDCINYFYSDFIDTHDKDFLVNVYSGKDFEIDYELHNAGRVFGLLDAIHFTTKAIINGDLIKYAFIKKFNDNKTNTLCDLIINDYSLLLCIVKYFESTAIDVCKQVINKCDNIDNEYYESLILSSDVSITDRIIILDKLLLCLDEKAIFRIDTNQTLSDFINENINMIYNKDDNLQELYVNRLNIKCENIKYNENIDITKMGNFVYKIMLDKTTNEECFVYKDLLKIYYLNKNVFNDDFENDNLSFIYNNTEENIIIDNIKTFPDEYVENCLLITNRESITVDDKMVELLYLLKNEDNVISIIKGLKGEIAIESVDYEGIIIINDENSDDEVEKYNERKKLIYDELLKNDNISLTMNDLYKYFSDFDWSQLLTDYISNNLSKLVAHNFKPEDVDNKILGFYKNMILKCKSVENIESLLNNSIISLQNTELVSLPPNLIKKLLQGNNIKYDINCMVALYSNGFEGIEWYIYNNINDFINNNQVNLLSEDIIIKIIDIFDQNVKGRINIDDDFVKSIQIDICQLIAKKYEVNPNFNSDGIIANYIISSSYAFNHRILNRVLTNKQIDNKLDILCNKLEYITKEDLVAIIKSSNSPFYEFLDNQTMVYCIDREVLQKNFNKAKKIVNFMIKNNLAKRMETQDMNTIIFKIL